MKSTMVAALALVCTLLGSAHGSADDAPTPKGAPAATQDQTAEQDQAAEQAEMMKKWQEVATPGEPHQALKPLEGKWTAVTKMWMAGPDGPATESEGKIEFKWILGGRYLQETYEGEMLGQPHHGTGLLGYDNFKKKYTSCWVDSASTTMLTSEGLLDRTGKVLTFHGTMDEWLSGEHDRPVKYVYRMISDDKHVFEIHDLGIVDGEKENTKIIEIICTRAK